MTLFIRKLKTRNMKDFFPIETAYDSEDYKLMKSVVNRGIDSHLEGFTKSEFRKSPHFNNKFLWNIHESELPILYRRLQELYDETGNEDYISFLEDVKNVADTSKAAIAAGEYSEDELDEMIDPYDPMDANQTITGEPTATSDLAIGGVDTAAPYSSAPDAFRNQSINDYINDDTVGQEMMSEIEISESELREMIKGQLSKSDDYTAESSLANKSVSITNDQDENGNFGETGKIVSIIEPTERQLSSGYGLINYMVEFPDGKTLAYLRSEFEPSVSENSSDSLTNKHGMNSKPQEMVDEDSQMKRHLAGQREKTVPLGQHAPHSQAAKK